MSSPKSRKKAAHFFDNVPMDGDGDQNKMVADGRKRNPYHHFDSRSFSIIFRGERSLALITHTDEDRDSIIGIHDDLVIAYRKAKVKVLKDILLLRYIWTDVDRVSIVFVINYL